MIKILACLLMLIDHIGYAFFPEHVELRLIGRLSMPLFAYAIARGAFFTSNRKKYIFRIAILAVISQIPFILFGFSPNVFAQLTFWKIPFLSNLNICFTWLFALLIIELYENKKIPVFIKFFAILIIVAITIFVHMDYGFYAVLLSLMFYFVGIKREFKLYENLFFYFIVSIISVFSSCLQMFTFAFLKNVMSNNIFQLFSIFSLFIIKFTAPIDKKIKINKYVFYWFYPVHLALIFGLRFIL